MIISGDFFKSLSQHNIIFIKTDFVESFFRDKYEDMEGGTTIITHNSDFPIDEGKRKYLDLPKVERWFGMNAYISHPKLIPIPIGIANKRYKHGNVELLEKIKSKKLEKARLLYINFNIRTNPAKRKPIMKIFQDKGYEIRTKLSQREYLEDVASSKFCISPPGNGVDCHRVWECLYLGTIPIVERHDAFKDFDVPIIQVDDWNDITEEYLRDIYTPFDEIEELSQSYWHDKITSGKS